MITMDENLYEELGVCHICGNKTLEPPETCQLDFGHAVQVSPSHCWTCGWSEPHPHEDLEATFGGWSQRDAFFRACWEHQIWPWPPPEWHAARAEEEAIKRAKEERHATRDLFQDAILEVLEDM